MKDKSKFVYLIDNFIYLQIWTPDLTVYNSAEAQIIDHFAKTNKIIYSNGNVLWVRRTRKCLDILQFILVLMSLVCTR